MLRTLLIGLLFSLCAAGAIAVEPMRYIYPPPESDADRRMGYYWELLQAALEATRQDYGDYELQPHSAVMNAERAAVTLAEGKSLTIVARATSLERERKLLPLRIPLDKGLTGYRLFLIRSEAQSRFDAVRSVEQLKAYRLGQGSVWIDVDILQSAGFTVVKGVDYDGLFRMLHAGRFDLFPRGLNEIGAEFAAFRPRLPELAVEKNLLLYYPLPRYYFFARTAHGELLAKRVDEGLRRLLKNGEFERRYRIYKRQMLADIDLAGRRVFRIANSQLSAETPLAQTELWDDLREELKAR